MSVSWSVSVPAYAKINLHLRILETRADGYHDVVTVLQTLALHDVVTCERHEGPFEIVCDEPGVPLDRRNLVWRAAQALADAVSRPEDIAGTRVTIVKRIPMQAGLGGGSADAAAALAGLVRAWEIDIDRASLHRIASGLGADVPFLLDALSGAGALSAAATPAGARAQSDEGASSGEDDRLPGRTMLGRGRGDELTMLAAFPRHAVLLVMPPFGVPTADAYRWHDERVAASRAADGGADADAGAGWPVESAGWLSRLASCRNDFELAIGPRHPEIPQTVAALRAAGATFAAMSGSGAAIFGLFPGDEAGERAASQAAARFARPGWRTFVTSTL
jgi:4-diphosphocytidyl-2-C-methyl-D-erythritol kinase